MQKFISWFAGGLGFGAGAFAALLASAAPGDAVYQESQFYETLTAQQKTKLGALVTDLWDGQASSVVFIACQKKPDAEISCQLRGLKSAPPSVVLDMLEAGQDIKVVGKVAQ